MESEKLRTDRARNQDPPGECQQELPSECRTWHGRPTGRAEPNWCSAPSTRTTQGPGTARVTGFDQAEARDPRSCPQGPTPHRPGSHFALLYRSGPRGRCAVLVCSVAAAGACGLTDGPRAAGEEAQRPELTGRGHRGNTDLRRTDPADGIDRYGRRTTPCDASRH